MPKKKVVTSSKSPKINWLLIGIVLLIIALALVWFKSQDKTVDSNLQPISTKRATFDFGNRTIELNGQALNFSNDAYADGSHTSTVESRSLNFSQTRAAAILIDNPGGSGTFYYLVGAMNKDGKEIYSKPVLIGDRISIEGISVDEAGAHDNGEISVDYVERPANAPMSAEPSIEKTAKYSFQDDGNLISVLH